jgi:invasion protein IalB
MTHKQQPRGFAFLGLCIALVVLGLVINAMAFVWHLRSRPSSEIWAEQSFRNQGGWVPVCFKYPGSNDVCHVVLSFSFTTGAGDEEFVILGLSQNYVTATAPIQRFTPFFWRVDEHPLRMALSAEGDGTVLTHDSSIQLISQMLAGKRLEIRFTESAGGQVVERSFSLKGFPAAYARYREMQQHPDIGASVSRSVWRW